MTHGLVLGKFYPPHAGHHHVIDTALAECDDVTVAVLASDVETIPMELRRAWLAERHPAARVVAGVDNHPIDYRDPEVYDLHIAVVRELCPEPIDVVYTSERYGDVLGERMGARHRLVDLARAVHPVSGTAVRADPVTYWDCREPPVRAWLTRRVAVVGAESSGTTTLARSLASHFRTAFVPELGREVSEQRMREGRFGNWDDADFEAIAAGQQAAEDRAARTSGPVLICDTDALATCIWQERYMGRSTPAVEAIAASRHYALYILTDCDVPFEQDGLRDGEHLREWMTRRFRDRLAERPEPVLEVSGPHADRMAAAVERIEGVLADGWDLADPIP